MKIKLLLLVSFSTLFFTPVGLTEETTDRLILKTQKDKVSYAIGLNIGKNLKQQSLDVEPKALLQGIKDFLLNTQPLLDDSQVTRVMEQFRKEMIANIAEENFRIGEKAQAENKQKNGVVTLASHLQYKVLVQGSGKTPISTDSVVVHYQGSHLNGKIFDSSYETGKPVAFKVTHLIKGWTEALQMMKTGDKWELLVPSHLAYGLQGTRTIAPNETLKFIIELLEIK